MPFSAVSTTDDVVSGIRLDGKHVLITGSTGGLGIIPKNVPQGAATSVWAATSAELVGHGGAYLLDAQIATPVTEEDPRTGYAPWAYDVAGAGRLWTQSEELTNVSFA